jgi:hypothetical protein
VDEVLEDDSLLGLGVAARAADRHTLNTREMEQENRPRSGTLLLFANERVK